MAQNLNFFSDSGGCRRTFCFSEFTEAEFLAAPGRYRKANTTTREASRAMRTGQGFCGLAPRSATPHGVRGVEFIEMGPVTTKIWKPLFARIACALVGAVALVGSAHSELPSSEVPGSSPAGAAPTRTPEGVPTPAVRDPNFPEPEPVAPRHHPDSPPESSRKRTERYRSRKLRQFGRSPSRSVDAERLYRRLKYRTVAARASLHPLASSKVPRFLRRPVFGFFLRE